MKRGRKKLRGEKADAYDKVTVLMGRAPAAKCFADDLREFAKVKAIIKPDAYDAHRAELFGVGILDRLAAIGAMTDEQQATFFDDVAKCLRSRKEWGPTGVVDIRRFLLKSILMLEYRTKPVDLGRVASQIAIEGGVTVDDRWISKECKKLGYTVRRQGRQ